MNRSAVINAADIRASAALRAERLGLAINGTPIFSDVDLEAPAGRLSAVVGPSGCGKSSFLASLNRLTDLVPGARVTGRVMLGGKSILQPGTDVIALRRRIGMIFQHPNPFPLSIRRNLTFPLREHGVRDKAERESRMEAALKTVGLWTEVAHRLDRPAQTLSGGQQQRLCLARALALEPEILLLDEPTSALDPLAAQIIEELIAGMKGGYTIIMVTHNLAQARRLADHVALFWLQDGAGRLIEHRDADAFFDDPRHELTRAYVTGRTG